MPETTKAPLVRLAQQDTTLGNLTANLERHLVERRHGPGRHGEDLGQGLGPDQRCQRLAHDTTSLLNVAAIGSLAAILAGALAFFAVVFVAGGALRDLRDGAREAAPRRGED